MPTVLSQPSTALMTGQRSGAECRDGFAAWLLEGSAASFLIDPATSLIRVSPALQPLMSAALGLPTLESLSVLVGRDSLGEEAARRAAVSCGPRDGDAPRRLWAVIPVESDGGDVLLVGLHIGLGDGDTPAAQEASFAAAMRDSERRHGINQPLTALSFLLENLLHAFETASPPADYRTRKAADLAQQVLQLRELLNVTRVEL